MPFLAAEMALPCVRGRRVAIFPVRGPAAKTAGFLGEQISGDILAGFYRPAAGRLEDPSENGSPSHPRLRAVFRRNGTEKVHVWYRTARNWLDLA